MNPLALFFFVFFAGVIYVISFSRLWFFTKLFLIVVLVVAFRRLFLG